MKQITSENNFTYLFGALILLLFAMAFLRGFASPLIHFSFTTVIVLVLLVDVHSIKHDRSWFWAVHFIGGMAILLYLSEYFFNANISEYIHLFIYLIFFLGSFILSWKQILLSKKVDENMIVGSLVLYLQLGLIWTFIYLIILETDPNAFHGLDHTHWPVIFSKVAYFSYVTLTTLGYGDISPNNSIAEFFVYLEAIVGVFYVAVVVSSLVSARLAEFTQNKK